MDLPSYHEETSGDNSALMYASSGTKPFFFFGYFVLTQECAECNNYPCIKHALI